MRQQVDEIVRRQFEINGIPAAQQDETQAQAAVEQALDPWLRYFLMRNGVENSRLMLIVVAFTQQLTPCETLCVFGRPQDVLHQLLRCDVTGRCQ